MSEYKRIYIWEWSVRLFHWLNVVCIIVLSVTGYIIGEPMKLFASPEAYNQYWFGTVRFLHFTAAYVFTFNIMFRLYWSFVGNKYSSWSNYIPHKAIQFKELFQVFKMDILLGKSEGHHLSIGHNSLASMSYFFIMLVSIIQVITGFTLYNDMSGMSFARVSAGVLSVVIGAIIWRYLTIKGKELLKSIITSIAFALVLYFVLFFLIESLTASVPVSDMIIRNIHHIIMWVFIVFTIIHIYLVFYHDYLEGRGVMSSMVGGWKFIKEKDLDNRKE